MSLGMQLFVYKREQRILSAVLLTRPQLSSSGGSAMTYTADVRVETQGVTKDGQGVRVPMQLKNVPIASGNRLLIYADIGQPVTLSRNPGGRYEIIGMYKRSVGHSRELIIVDLCAERIIEIIDDTTSSGPVTYGFFATRPDGYGSAAYGLLGTYHAGLLIGTSGGM